MVDVGASVARGKRALGGVHCRDLDLPIPTKVGDEEAGGFTGNIARPGTNRTYLQQFGHAL